MSDSVQFAEGPGFLLDIFLGLPRYQRNIPQKHQSARLANEAQRLKMRIRNNGDCCLRSKFKLLQDEANYAAEANRNAILQAKQARLYSSND